MLYQRSYGGVALVLVTTPTFAFNVSGSIMLANPALLVVPSALNEADQGNDLDNYETVGLQADTFYQTHVVQGVPQGGATLTFSMKTTAHATSSLATATGDLNYVVFDGAGNRIEAAGTPTNSDQQVVFTDAADLGHGTYQVFVYASAGAQFTYTLSVVLS